MPTRSRAPQSRTNSPSRGQSPRSSSSRQPTRRPSILDNLTVLPIETEGLPGFAELGLPRPMVDALHRAGIDAPFPVQAATIPSAVAGRDVIGRAATGAGKTLAFGLPLLVRLDGGRRTPRRPRGLVLVPTRELAMQVTDALSPLADSRNLRVRLVAGGLPINKQIASMNSGVDILVATPGRLEDLIERRAVDLGGVDVTVIDEADHMADLGFLPVVKRLLDQTPSTGQRLLFSATLDGDVAVIVDRYLNDPAAFALSSSTPTVDTMEHHVWRTSFEDKYLVAASIGAREGRTLMFVRTKHGADRLAKNLGRVGVAAGVLHGGRSQSQRTRALEAFRSGEVPLLVATDVAARGIHVDDVSLVVHVDPPTTGKDYVHRSGRTARAGRDGVVVMLSIPSEDKDVRTLLRDAGVRPEQRDVRPGDPVLSEVAGARQPSGQPLIVRADPTPTRSRFAHNAPRPDRGARPQGNRPTGAGAGRRGRRSAVRQAG